MNSIFFVTLLVGGTYLGAKAGAEGLAADEIKDNINNDSGHLAAILGVSLSEGSHIASAKVAVAEARNYHVGVQLEIDNYSIWPLYLPITYAKSGTVIARAVPVKPATKEIMVMRKTGYTATGSYGTVSWEVDGKRRVIVMWSAPFNFNHYSNWLAVGIIGADDHYTPSWADTMYDKNGTFTRGEYYYENSKPIQYCDSALCVYGTMGTSHHPTAKISVFPAKKENLANSIKSYVEIHHLESLVYE